MNDILNPFAKLIDSGIEIRNALADAVTQLELAQEAELTARRKAKEYREEYESQETEFIAEKMVTLTGKNAESRKAEMDAALVTVRTNNSYMAGRWSLMNTAVWEWEEAKTALEQCSKRYRATEAAAELTAAMLRAAAR